MRTFRSERATAVPELQDRAPSGSESACPYEPHARPETTHQPAARLDWVTPGGQASNSKSLARSIGRRLRLTATPMAAVYNTSIDWYENLGRRAPLRFAVLTVVILLGL